MNKRIQKKCNNKFKCYEFYDGEIAFVIARSKKECLDFMNETVEIFGNIEDVSIRLLPHSLYKKIKTKTYTKQNKNGIFCKEKYISISQVCKTVDSPCIF